MKSVTLVLIALLAINHAALADVPIPVTHRQFQAVHADGSSSFNDAGPWQVVLEGILLNNPEEWLDPTPDPTPGPWQMGGQWEIFIQGEADDHAGTFCWIGQNYGNGPGDENYTNQEWLHEIWRLNRDPNTGYIFRAGDRIRVTGTYLFYAGKLNINENHDIDPEFDFKVELVKPAVGLPQPEEIGVSDLKEPDGKEIFDPDRLTGGEYYQGRLVRVADVNIVDPENWATSETITIRDANGLTFPVQLCIGQGISRHRCPTGQIDVIGVMDQKAPGWPPDHTKGYRLLVLNYDGNGLVLTDHGHRRGNLPADVNDDFVVDFTDFAELADRWLESRAGLAGSGG